MRALTVIEADECRRPLTAHHLGRIAVIREGRPLVVPVQYRYDGISLAYRTRIGGLLDPAAGVMPVAVEIDGNDPVYHLGWDVVLEGAARRSAGGTSSASPQPWFDCDDRCTVCVEAAAITGRRILGF